MIQNGVQKVSKDLRDYDFLKSRLFDGISIIPSDLPTEMNVDAGLWIPNQNSMGLPLGCTGMTQADLCADEDGVIYDPADVYDNTPPGGRGTGRDIRASLNVLVNRGVRKYLTQDQPSNKRPAYFAVKPAGKIDYFDAIRIAIWINQHEKRSVSVATPWYPVWELSGSDGILQVPQSYAWTNQVSGHNWKISGWKTISGVVYLIGKSWQGDTYGDGGWCYVSREIFNNTMKQWGTGAFTVADDSVVVTVDKSITDRLVAFIYFLYGNTLGKFA